jgi:uncharacterized protein (TIGR03067 family)
MPRRTIALMLALMGVAAADRPRDEAAKKDLEQLQGTWTMAALEVDGKLVPEAKLKGTTLIIKGNKYIVKVRNQTHETAFQLDPTKKPKEIDMTFAEGANKDRVHKGIYALEGDTFKLCRGQQPDRERPTEFGTWPDTGIFLVTWKRQSP